MDATATIRPRRRSHHCGQHGLRGVDHAHEIDVHHPLEQRRIGAAEGCGLRRTRIGNQDVDRLPRRGLGNGRLDRSLIGDVGHFSKLRRAGCDGFIQRCAIAAEHGDRRTGFRQRCRYRKANAPPAAGDKRMGGTRQLGHRVEPPADEHSAYILNFKLLQGSGRHVNPVFAIANAEDPSPLAARAPESMSAHCAYRAAASVWVSRSRAAE